MKSILARISKVNLTLILIVIVINSAFSQQQKFSLWTDVVESMIPVTGTRYIKPTQFKTMHLKLGDLKTLLLSAPSNSTTDLESSSFYLDIPLPKGGFETFKVCETPMMEDGLAQMFPEIKTYSGVGVNNGGMYLKFDVTPQGFHGMILTAAEGTIFIDPYYFGGLNAEHYIIYNRRDFVSTVKNSFDCLTVTEMKDEKKKSYNGEEEYTERSFGTCQLRTYRLALAATGEYSAFHGGTVALAQAAQVTTMNRVNGVYERDIAIHMNIVANNNLIVYTNAGTDPYTNGNPGTMINQVQTNCDGVIGSANYDIGHVFGTNSGGLAGLGVVCTGGQKARGVTGSAAPIGDPFDIDYVCHEMGHQFGCNHTFNSNAGACNGNQNNATAFEPGSGSTIMGYAGICGAHDLQPNSDDYFHGISLQEIDAEIAGHTCEVITGLANGSPNITTVTTAYTIPISTPFALTVAATDPNPSNVLTYCWEQMNGGGGITMPPLATATAGPNFRSWDPVTSPTRYFPRLSDLAAGTVSQWEVLPSVARTMNFRVVVRDNAAGGGCNDHHDVTVTVAAGAGPFVVTYPSATGITWNATSTETVTWNVANTNTAPVSCANVDILLSTDGGLTYPITLASNVPNDGSQVVTVPNNPSTTCRVMVRCTSTLFFDISNNNFTITAPTSDYSLNVPTPSVTVCPPTAATYTVNVGSIGGYVSPVTLSVSGVPAGATSNFSVNPVTPGNSSVLTVNPGTAVAGTYNLTITGNSASGIHTFPVTLIISSPTPGAVTLTTPVNGATNVNPTPTFNWNAVAGAGVTYTIEIATNPGFAPIANSASGLTTNSYTPGVALASGTLHYWRVRATNPCGTGPNSAVFTFTTGTIACSTFTSTNVPVTISGTGTPTVTSTLTIPTLGTITDVNVVNLNGTHTWISDLTFRLTSPLATQIILFGGVCTDLDNWGLNLDDEAAPGALPCPPTGGGTYQPQQALTAFDGQSLNGVWTLTISDAFDQDGGTLTSWGLNVCYLVPPPTCSLAVTTTPVNATCGLNNGSATANPTNTTGTVSYVWSHGPTTQAVSSLAPGSYTVTVSDGSGCTSSSVATINAAPDATNPVATCQNVTIFVNGSGSATLTAAAVNNGSTDNCAINTMSVTPNTFSCSDLTFANAPRLFFSEYIEGSATNRCVEIANFTGAAVNLSGYQVKVFSNGTNVASGTINLSGTVANNDVYVICNNTAAAPFQAISDLDIGTLNYSGNDAIVLFGPGNDTLDIIGKIGCDPGVAWTIGANSTTNQTLRRNADVAYGIMDNPSGACNVTSFPTLSTQWSTFPIDNNANLGAHTFNTLNPVVFTVTDATGNSATCTSQITVLDNIAPTITPPANLNIPPNSGCNATGVVLGNPTTSDNCSVATVTNNAPATFPSGTTNVTWTVADFSGNTATATQTVTVTDNIAPVPNVGSLPNATGECTVTVTAPTATDNCLGVVNGTTVNPTTYNTQGSFVVTWTYSDGAGNSATQTQTVIVDDTTPPVAPSLSNVTGQCSATPSVPTATDNCAGTINGTTSTTFPINTQGTTVVTWTFNDGNGNSSTALQNVIIDDTTPPVSPSLSNVTGQCSATPPTPSTTDNCVGTVNGTTSTTFPINTQGTTVVTWTFNDGNGNSSTALQNVIIDDTTPPVSPSLSNVTGQCSATPSTPSTTDNCVGTVSGTTSTTFPINTQGTTVVTWTFNDGNGNSSTALQNVIIDDTTPPVSPSLSNVTGQCSATPTTPSTTDNCAGTVNGTTSTTFPINTQGTTVVTWTFNDGNGNSSTAIQNVIIDDTTFPILNCNSVTVNPSSGNPVTLLPGMVTTSASDNCSIVDTTVSPNFFDCGMDGMTIPVVVSLTDIGGNVTQCSTTVQVVGVGCAVNQPPVATCVSGLTVSANGSCQYAASANEFDGGSTDPDGNPLSFSISPAGPFGIGTTPVTLTVSDGSLTNTCNTTITVVDNTSPVPTIASLPNATDPCSVTLTAPTANDNCSGIIIATTTTVFPITAQGTTIVTWTYNDASGNISTQNQTVIIDDNTVPVPDQLNLPVVTGDCSANLIPPTATDNCSGSIIGTTTDPTSYSSPGNYMVTWNYIDAAGNSSSQAQMVVIDDNTAPVVVSCPSTINAIANSINCSALVSWTPPTSTDNCSAVIVTSTHTPGSLFASGTTMVTYNFEDASGNISSCSFNVIVDNDLTISGSTNDEDLGADGSIDITVGGGTSPYSASWSSGQSTEDINGLVGGTYTVTVTDSNGCTIIATYIVNSTLGIDHTEEEVLTFYPNPTDGWLQITSNNLNEKALRLHNSLGQVIYITSFNQSTSIDMTNYSCGVYHITIGSKTYKVIKK